MGRLEIFFPNILRFCFSVLLLAVVEVVLVEGSSHHQWRKGLVKPTKLFVFGDSYADTGNIPRSFNVSSWKFPYGITFPGKPSGRFSDGLLLTDFVAKFLRLRSPIPYTVRNYEGWKVKYGMNFAFGGTGVFNTVATGLPNMTTQIDFFQQLTSSYSKNQLYSERDLQESVALVSVAGNDYGTYLTRVGSLQGIKNFTIQVVNQLSLDLRRIHGLGVKKVLVLAMEPISCLPVFTVSNSFQACNSSFDSHVGYHNLLLQQAVAKLNNDHQSHGRSPFIILDLYSGFMSVLQGQDQNHGKPRFENALRPCCMGIDENWSCGSVDEKGNKLFTLCEDPTSKFFWDTNHPSQAGWEAVYSLLTDTLQQVYF